MEQLAKNIDRLATTLMCEGGCADRWIIPQLYEAASQKAGNMPVSLVGAKKLIESIGPGDTVVLTAGFGAYPNVPFGETDGPLGVASLAHAIWFGLRGIPVIVGGERDIDTMRQTVKAAGLNVVDFALAKETSSAAAVSVLFPNAESEDGAKFAAKLMNDYQPKALVAVEAIGPNKNGVKHCGGGTEAAPNGKLPGLEHLFYEAEKKGIFSMGIIDLGNELGSGTIEDDVRRIVPNANVCKCPCKSGTACAVRADVVYPVAISNFGAHAIAAMMGALLKKPEILHDIDTERRMLEACIMAGAVEGLSEAPIMAEDGVDIETCQGYIRMLHSLVKRTLQYAKIKEVRIERA
jgi:hypothetical protein